MPFTSEDVLGLPYAYTQPVNLPTVLKVTGRPTRPERVTTGGRDVWRLPVIEHPGGPSEVSGPALPAVYVDGIQARILLAVRDDGGLPGERRPIWLDYAAGAAVYVGTKPELWAHDDRFWITASTLDGPWLAQLRDGPPVWLLAEDLLDTICPAADRLLETTRIALEDRVIAQTAVPEGGLLVVDGSIRGRRWRRGMVGVIKSIGVRLATDETALRTLPAGWRSPTITLPSGRADVADTLSAYIRIHDSHGLDWTTGMIRIEARSAADLESAAALAWHHRQHPGSDDPRWACQIEPIRLVEQIARTRRPELYAHI